jgi:undecaprenyl pyrophosphate phosphatase UppP
LAAVVLAGVVGYAALRGLLAFLGRGAFAWFAGYCAVVGGVVLVVA